MTTVQSAVLVRPRRRQARVLAPLACLLVGWRLLGANRAPAAVELWTFSGPGGGLLHTLVLDPIDQQTVYAGTEEAGVFKSTDGGVSWGAMQRGLPARAADAAQPQLYAGTHGAGVFRSTDAGAEWRAATNGLSSLDVNAVDPQSSDVVYAGYGFGLLKSTDGGATWRAMNSGLPEGSVGEMVFDPIDPRLMYASARDVFASTDAAATWSALGSGLDDSALALAIDPLAGATLYVGTARGVFVLQRTDLDPTRTAAATPTPTPTVDPRCPPDQITLVPSAAPPGTRVVLSGECYFLHSGRRTAVYFDATLVGEVTGDTAGNYALDFTVPSDALPGSHLVRVVGAQSTRFDVQPSDGTPTPTVTPPLGSFCPAENMTVVPNAGPPGTRIVVSGQCYFIHSGRSGEIYLDDTRFGLVQGDTPGNYQAGFVVPSNAAPGPHVVRLVTFGGTSQSAVFDVEAVPPPLSQTPTPTATPTPSASATGTPSAALSSSMSGGGGCALAPARCGPTAYLILFCAPAALLSKSLVHKRKQGFTTSNQGGKGS